MKKVQQNEVIELRFISAKNYRNPFYDINFSAVFTFPDGTQKEILGFWAGSNVWKVRFSSSVIGKYTYKTVCSDNSNSGLHDKRGEFKVIPYRGNNPLFKYGPLKVSENKKCLEYSNGKPFFYLADTWWMALSKRIKFNEFKELVSDRVSKGFSVILLVAGLFPDMEPLDKRCENEGGLPWEENFKSINPKYFDYADRKIEYLVKMGLVPCIVGCWGYYLSFMGVDKIKKHWEYLVARYGAYPVIWCLAGETVMPYYLSKNKEEESKFLKKKWTEVAEYVRKVDKFNRLITTHPTQFGREQLEKPELLDFELLQTGHGGILSFPNTIKSIKISLKKKPVMPVLIGEVNYEGILGSSKDDIQRLTFWSSILSGIAGYTYGANGLWQFNLKTRPYGASPHGTKWGDIPWKEVYRLPGSCQIGMGKKFLTRYRWWEFQPHPEWIEIKEKSKFFKESEFFVPYAAGNEEVRIIYLSPLFAPCLKIKNFEKNVKYTAFFYDPETGKKYPEMEVKPDLEGKWEVPKVPVFKDLVVVIEKR
ncbi:DUF4038 domain-containing protein [bacterium]|nr:DUF4038 domain-containing protein [bacterium]